MEKNPIKNNLFRFVTLRNPQLIDEQEKDPGFVFHPNTNESEFYTAIEGLDDAQKTTALTTLSDTFSTSAFKTKAEVRKAFETLYDFSAWLMRNKDILSFEAITTNSIGVEVLSPENEIRIWDNLIYQTINQKSDYVREALIQLLIANKFITAFTSFTNNVEPEHVFTKNEKKDFIRRAHASVVISKTLFVASETATTSALKSFDAMERAVDTTLAKREITQYKTLETELKKVEVSYRKEAESAYKTAFKNHEATIAQIIADTAPTLIDGKDEEGNPIQIETYPNLVLPKFSYQQTNPLTQGYLTGKLSETSLAIFLAQEWNTLNGFSEVFNQVKEKKKAAYKTIFSKINKKKAIHINGTKLNLKDTSAHSYCFTAVDTVLPTGEHGISMILGTDYAGATITDATIKITYTSSGLEKNSLGVQNMISGTNSVTAFFEFDPIIRSAGTIIEFGGEFTLDNGKTYIFSTTSVANTKGVFRFQSCTQLKDGTTDDSEKTDTVFGVTKLGIADFRRVEQEVCCYVPGEVSHIENIMAREYKERATRSLTSSETTIERSEERERENLTDSTTTERNEMQSEIATVLNEDQSQSYGANAGVRGEFADTTFDASSYSDFSSSSASSLSNSQAATYAQEVTERAMERIVQKVSTKRTSRILKEFEENNTHGYDNRKGEQHITGVYRWVDKIYKNKLINYGKRLMYEFAIPEPSKFFKEALYKQVTNEESTDAIILPEAPLHPSEYEIHNASDLNEGNYQEIAAIYGAEVIAKPLDIITVGDSASSINPTEKSISLDGNVDIPEGYLGISSLFSFNALEVGDYDDRTMTSVAVGDIIKNSHRTLGRAYIHNESNDPDATEYLDNPVLYTPFKKYYSNAVPYAASVTNAFSASFNVSIQCILTNEAKEQWQNDTYNAIIKAYEEKLSLYNEAMQAENVIPDASPEKVSFNPLFNRSIEKREIKRIAIELLAAQKGKTTANNNYDPKDSTTKVAKVKKNEVFQSHLNTVKFFEQAFDWEIMAYIFYPYFYADEKNWVELFQATDAADPIFQAFLQSGMARAVVPIRPGFEEAVNWYMETGELWSGSGLVVDTEDDLYVSISEEMQTVEGELEATWETRLPTNLTLLQAGSIGLNVEGLPCNTDCDDWLKFDSDGNPVIGEDGKQETENPITQTNELIGGDDGVSIGGVGKFVVS